MQSRSVLKGELLAESLRCFGEARLAVTGTSMLPSIWPGDLLEIRRQNMAETLPGQVVLFAREGRFFAHRVVKRIRAAERTLLVTRGDRLRDIDPPVFAEELLGRVTAIERGSRRIVPRLTFWGRMASWILGRSEFCTRILLHFSRIFAATFHHRGAERKKLENDSLVSKFCFLF